MLKQSYPLPTKKRKPNKIIMGFAAMAGAAVIGATGLAAASPGDKPSKAECAAAGYTNYGQCVKDWAHGRPGGGYGGNGNNANININLKLNNSNHNVIQIIVNFFS